MFLLLVLLVPFFAHAEEGISRRDGFLLIWESIRRPAVEVSTSSFQDVEEGDVGFLEITYARRRGILDDMQKFYPDDLLTQKDALLWIMRTRNTAELPDMQEEHLMQLLERYPIAELDESTVISSRSELIDLMTHLDQLLRDEEHRASLYAEDFHGKTTAFGETFDMHDLTAAHRSFPHNTLVKVTNLDNEESVVVRINDRGPYIEGRSIDLSLAAFESIADRARGVIAVRLERLGDSELVDACEDKPRRYQKRVTRDVRFHRGVPHTWNSGKTLWLGSTEWFVIRGIQYPDGSFMRMQEFINPKEKERFAFTPSLAGKYILLIGTKEGRSREFWMSVTDCQ